MDQLRDLLVTARSAQVSPGYALYPIWSSFINRCLRLPARRLLSAALIVLSLDKLNEQRRWEKLETECSLVNIHARFVGMPVKASPFTPPAVN